MAPHPGRHWSDIIETRGVTQRWVCQQLGCSPKHLNQIVRCSAMPSVELTVAFAQLMGVAPHLLWHMKADYELCQAMRG